VKKKLVTSLVLASGLILAACGKLKSRNEKTSRICPVWRSVYDYL